MLETMRRSSQSLAIYLLFGIIIAVFIVSFGPQSVGGFSMPGSDAGHALKVDGRELQLNDFRWAYLTAGGRNVGLPQAKAIRMRETVMDKLIERELLAAEADKLGLVVNDEEVEDFIASSNIMLFGRQSLLPDVQKNGAFDYDQWKRFVQWSGLSPKQYIDEQRRELQAQRVRNLLRGGLTVSESEVKDRWVRESTQVNLEYVRFPFRKYEEQVAPTSEEVAAYATANEAKLKEQYNERKALYEKVPKQLKLRQILVKLEEGASADAEAAAKKKADGLLATINKAANKADAFVAAAKASSDDARTKGRGGDLGWKPQGATGLGASVEEKVFAAKAGDIVGPEKAAGGFYLVSVEGAREGDLDFDAVKLELAEAELRKEQTKARAKADAEAALAKVKAAPDKTLKDLFPAPGEAKEDAKDGKKKDAPKVAADAPTAQETGLFARRGAIVEGIGPAPELANAAFSLSKDAPVAGPYEVAESFVVAKLKERQDADLTEFAKKKSELVEGATELKGRKVVEEWAMRRCSEAKQKGRISVNPEALKYEDGQEGPIPYEPCAPRVNPFGPF